jgi:hypothetical protein
MKRLIGWILLLVLVPNVASAAGVGIWRFDEGTGSTLADESIYSNHGQRVESNPGTTTFTPGVHGEALAFEAPGGRVLVPDAASLDVEDALTLTAWVRPAERKTQYIVKKGSFGESDGYELALSSTGLAFARFNQATAGNAYKIYSTSQYRTDGQTWVHLAVTLDGKVLRLYVDGVLESELAAPALSVGSNDRDLSIGAEDDGGGWVSGAIDDVHIYARALPLEDIQSIIATGATLPDADDDGAPDSDDAFPDDPTETVDFDGDGVGDNADLDDDGDGLPDAWEDFYGLDPLAAGDALLDIDGDGLNAIDEFAMGTSPIASDSDADGVDDGIDAFPGYAAEWLDNDADGTGDNADLDDDNDGLPDAWETQHGFDPLSAANATLDADADGSSNLSEFAANTDPHDADSDDDGTLDGADVFPNDPAEWVDTDGDGTGDNADLDDDGDGLPDTWEQQYGLDRLNAADAGQDSDGDGLSNLAEFSVGTDPNTVDFERWISGHLAENAEQPLPPLVDSATLRFDLTPRESEYLYGFYRNAKKGSAEKTE